MWLGSSTPNKAIQIRLLKHTFQCRTDTGGQTDAIKVVAKHLVLFDGPTPTIRHLNSRRFPAKYPIFSQNWLTGRADENTFKSTVYT